MDIEKKFTKILKKKYQKFGIDVSLIESDAYWDNQINQSKYTPVGLTSSHLKYTEKYLSQDNRMRLIRLELLDNENSIALVSLFFQFSEDTNTVHSGDKDIKMPLLLESAELFDVQSILDSYLDSIEYLSRELNISPTFCSARGSMQFSSLWNDSLVQRFDEITPEKRWVVDLEKSEVELHSSIRKSYRSIINKGYNEFVIEILDANNINEYAFESFKKLHREVSGRITRPESTWQEQYYSIKKDCAILLIARLSGEPIGGAYFNFSKDESIYFVGAYSKNAQIPSSSHTLQWAAIKYLKTKGTRLHILGNAVLSESNLNIDNKILSISNFKKGFSTSLETLQRYKFQINTEVN